MTRYVRTPAGEKRYGVPIGSPIPGKSDKAVAKLGKAKPGGAVEKFTGGSRSKAPKPRKAQHAKATASRTAAAAKQEVDARAPNPTVEPVPAPKPKRGANKQQTAAGLRHLADQLRGDPGTTPDVLRNTADDLEAGYLTPADARAIAGELGKQPHLSNESKAAIAKVVADLSPAKKAKAAPKALEGPPRNGRQALRVAPVSLGADDFDRQPSGDEIDPEGLVFYRDGNYTAMNALYRGNLQAVRDAGEDPEQLRQYTESIDAAFAASPLRAPVVVHRHVDSVDHIGTGNLAGAEFKDGAPTSTTADQTYTDGLDGGVHIEMHVPAGIGAIQLSGFPKGKAKKGVRTPAEEAELLLQRNLVQRVVSDTTVNGRRQLVIEVVSA